MATATATSNSNSNGNSTVTGIGTGNGTGTGGSRAWGRFTRNFVVQGTAAEWALAWLARIRQRLAAISVSAGRADACERSSEGDGGAISGAPLGATPHLVYFLHDEVVVHTPAEHAAAAAREIEAAAAWAGRLLFPAAPVTFPVTASIVDIYGDAKEGVSTGT